MKLSDFSAPRMLFRRFVAEMYPNVSDFRIHHFEPNVRPVA